MTLEITANIKALIKLLKMSTSTNKEAKTLTTPTNRTSYPAMSYRELSAKPDSSFTYNATVYLNDGTGTEFAKTQYRRLMEEGNIKLTNSAQAYKVIHSTNSGVWRLQVDDHRHRNQPLIIARKPKWYRKTIIFEMDGETYEMDRASEKKRDYQVERIEKGRLAQGSSSYAGYNYSRKEKKKSVVSRTKVGEIVSAGALKRSYTLQFDENVRIELPLFCYWIVSLLNKRSAQDGFIEELIDPFTF